jgi:flavin-dependent dehydrogenase
VPQTWQVIRSEFDKMMLTTPASTASTRRKVRVLEVLFDGDRCGRRSHQQNNDREVFAKVVVDAAGRLRCCRTDSSCDLGPGPEQGAIWTYWKARTAIAAATKAPRS